MRVDTLRRLKYFLMRRAAASPQSIGLHGSGFSVGNANVAWSDVSEITAYKLDRLTTDEAILEFAFGSGERVAVGEDQPGFGALETAMTSVFPAAAAWRALVLQPAFARNYTVLYRRT
ncbi:hypothetical protein GCM10027191_09060 [Novilysobacter erysipheiresistens]